jgi:hypothetical protein
MGKIKVNSDLAIYTNDAKNAITKSAGRKLIVSTHGGWSESDGHFSPRRMFNVLVSFYAEENFSLMGDVTDALSGAVETVDTPMVHVKNYQLARFEDDPKNEELSRHLNDRFDVLKVRTKWFGSRTVDLKSVLQTLKSKGYKYPEVCCLFCRYTGGEAAMEARQRTSGESEKLNKLSKINAITEELKSKGRIKS